LIKGLFTALFKIAVLFAVIGGLMAIYGRVRATTKIG